MGPHTPDLARPVSAMAEAVETERYPDEISVALIGSCTNSSYEDISRIVQIVRQAKAHGARARIPLLISPGSEQIHSTIVRDGLMAELESIGATVLANACGPCIGQWQRDEIQPGVPNSIVTSFNRNFPRRNDGNPDTLAFIASPEIVAAYALAGRLSFNPATDSLEVNGTSFKLDAPGQAPDLPPDGFVQRHLGLRRPAGRRELRGDRDRPGQPAPPEARPVRAVGWQALREAPPALEDPGQNDDRSHLTLPAPGCDSEATSTTSPTTCSTGRSTPSPASPARP